MGAITILGIDQFEMIIYDTFQMDAYYPPTYHKNLKEFKRISYEQWGLDELKDYIARHFSIDNYAEISDYISWTNDFIKLMTEYSKIGGKNAIIFQSARKMAMNVKDTLIAMQ